MRKFLTLLTLIVVAVGISSCSSDDKPDTGLSAKIDGVSKKFINVTVTEEEYDEYSDYIVTAIQSDDPSKSIQISLGKDFIGTESIYYIQYFDGENYYQLSSPDIVSNVTESSNTKVKATFSGILVSDVGMGNVAVTDGTIDVKP